MKKPSAKICEEIARLQEQLRQAETREAERIGRIAFKAGLGDIEVEEADLEAAFEDLVKRFRGGEAVSTGRKGGGAGHSRTSPATAGTAEGSGSEA
ncbi:conjugal transfer protein TraC [Rhizobium sp. BK251]|uniref:conjugal transfer protein TraC n=1 Tax=Rhizobium sp. BK251 TaxID=2512125 RepID=UPI00104FD247|nr:conjugal transfer protein TraC [Rhizobium sp. BK251]TCL66354.1 TraC-like protein [Rhizobium sp. BK251]